MVSWRRSYCIDAECNLILIQTCCIDVGVYTDFHAYFVQTMFCDVFAANIQVVLTQEMLVLY